MRHLRGKATLLFVAMASLLALGSTAACTLLVDLDGLDTGGVLDDGGGIDAAAAETSAGSRDGAATDAAIDAADANVVVDSDASFSLVVSNGLAFNTPPVAAAISTGQPVAVGDFLVVGCDTESGGGALTHDLAAATAKLTAVGPFSYHEYQAMVWTGFVASVPAGGVINLSIAPTNKVGFLDCTINAYRGGTAAAAIVDTKITTGTGAMLAHCGPVKTVRGGIAYFIAVRNSCAGAPLHELMLRNELEGNPNGDLVPTDGAMVESDLADCNTSTGDWLCLTLAVSP